MKQTIESFKDRQAGTLKILQELQAFLAEGKSYGIDADKDVDAKLAEAIRNVRDDRLRVALIGGFSEGKTAIAAAWLERLDKSTMKISHQESSNAVTVYEAGPDCVLIDTPGLFGFKEDFDVTTQTVEKYKELTRRYVSRAHLVLYVMDPANPIKDSHEEDLNWLFRTLNLLPRTVFVLSRFDEIADVEDEREYARHLAIKQQNVTDRLGDLIALSAAEASELAVVAVAADPFDMGIEHWLSDLERFRALSRIALLQRATSEKVALVGGVEMVVEETRRSIVRDVMGKQLPIAVQNDDRIAQEVERLESMNNKLGKQILTVTRQVGGVRTNLRRFATDFFADLILQAQGQSMETFTEFFERNIGSDGVVLAARLQNGFEENLSSVKLEVSKMSVGFDNEVNHFNATLRTYGKQGLAYMVKSGFINNTTVLAARDGIVGVAKVVGLDLGKLLKFKPWGAINFAKGLNGVLSAVGLALEVWDSLEKAQRERKFREVIATMVGNLEKQRAELLALVNGPAFEDQFFPDLVGLRANVAEVSRNVSAGQHKREQFHRWRERGEAIDAEFRMLDAA